MNYDFNRTYQEARFRQKAIEYASRAAQNSTDLECISSRFYAFFTENFDNPYNGNLMLECHARLKAFELIIGFANSTTVNALIANATKAYAFIVENSLFGYAYNPHLKF